MRRSIGVGDPIGRLRKWKRNRGWDRVVRAARCRHVSWPFALATFLLGIVAWWLHHQGIPWRLHTGDAWEYAEMARRLARGAGFTTGVIFPAELWLGVGADHPAVKPAPLWPLVLAGPFALLGASAPLAHGVVGATFGGVVAAAAALATRQAGRGAGLIAAIAVATHPWVLLLTLDAVSETLFALTVIGVFLLCALRAPPFAIGAACGLAYLARYNGAVLLPMALALLWQRRSDVRVRSLLVCAAGFAVVALPWWIRNFQVAGDPFYTLLNLNLHVTPLMTKVGGSLFFQLEPDLASGVAIDPWDKARAQLPLLLRKLPLAAASLPAFAGVAWACWRRDALALGFAFCAVATFGVVALAMVLGRYFVPLLPAMLALGVVGWVRYGGPLRLPALALLLVAPCLPTLPSALPDLALFAQKAEGMRRGAFHPPPRDARVRDCLPADVLLLAEDAARIVWQYDRIAIYAPASPATIGQILDAHPVAALHLSDAERIPAGRLVPLPACGPGWYAPAPGSPGTGPVRD